MQVKSFVTWALLTVGLLAGCGGVEAEAEGSTQALSDCGSQSVCDRFRNRCIFLENRPADECNAEWDQCMAALCPGVEAAVAE